MGSVERKEREAVELKTRIIEAAAAIIAEEGYDRLSIRGIAERIEYSPAIIYHYFKDKGEIVAHLVEVGYRRIADSVKGAPVYADDPVRTLYEAFSTYSRIVLESPNLFRIALLGQGWELPDLASDPFRGGLEGTREHRAARGIRPRLPRGGEVPFARTGAAAQVILSAVHGLLARFILEPSVPPKRREKLLRTLIEVLVLGLDA